MSLPDDYGDAPDWADEPWAGFRATDLEMPGDISPPSTHREREDTIKRAWINGHFAAFTGDCPTVAGALARFFDADALVWLVNHPG